MPSMPLGPVKDLSKREVETVMSRQGPYVFNRAWVNWRRRAGREMRPD